MEQVQRLLHLNIRLGQGPVWNVNERALYWVDIDGRCSYRYHPATGALAHFDVGQPIGVLLAAPLFTRRMTRVRRTVSR